MARKTSTVTLADGRVVPVRQLGWLQIRSSHQAAQQASARNLIAMGGAEFMAAFKAINAGKPEGSPAPATPDALDGHDLFTVLRSGIPTFTSEQIEDLDEADVDVLARAILALSPQPRTEEQEKNAASPSTDA